MEKEEVKNLLDVERSTRSYLYSLNEIVQGRDVDGLFHPSGIGYCSRKLQYHYLTEQPIHKIAAATRSIFDMGHAVHDMLQARLRKVLERRFKDLDVDVILTIEESITNTEFALEHELAGSADGVIRLFSEGGEKLTAVVYEAKSISSKGWAKLRSPLIKHRMQASIYAKCVDAPLILFEYYCKDNSRSKWYLVDRDEEALDNAMRQVEKVSTATKKLKLVPREGSTYECQDCPYLESCLPEGVQY
jgi:CRISPR/Cas system-associated exonuclease Cas4 (RecB family)